LHFQGLRAPHPIPNSYISHSIPCNQPHTRPAARRPAAQTAPLEFLSTVLRKAFRDKATAKGFKFPAPAKAVKVEVDPVETLPAEVIFDVTLGDILEGC
jgi:hypothetical protein